MIFDDFYANAQDRVLSVAELNRTVAGVLSESIPASWIQGEISNFVQAASGHWYFTLKDQHAAVKAVMFRGKAGSVNFRPQNGLLVEVFATVSLYEPRGDYQIQVTQMRQAGLGNLHEAFLKIKQKLEAEGLFATERKKAIPRYVQTVGVVTSLGAAALQDVLTALRRRAPHVNVIVYPSLVQGVDAPLALMQALAQAQMRDEVDVVLLVRGGGSLEDLWAFNDERLARFMSQMNLPLISGVGHETDFTIADFVADIRAPTPTAAAEMASHSQAEWLNYVYDLVQRLDKHQLRRLETASIRLDRASTRLISPKQKLEQWQQKQDFLRHRLIKAGKLSLQQAEQRWQSSVKSLQQQGPNINGAARQLQTLLERLPLAHKQYIRYQQQSVQGLRNTLQAFNPRAVLQRGYSITYDEKGKVILSAAQLHETQGLRLEFAQGTAEVQVLTHKE